MVASVHFADLGPRAAAAVARSWASPVSSPGLRHAEVILAVPFSGSSRGVRAFGRLGLVAFWDDAGAVGRFREEHPLGLRLGHGWHAVLEPVRVTGNWPGLPPRAGGNPLPDEDEPVLGITITRVRPGRTVRFLRDSAAAQREALAAPGMVWGTNLADPARRVGGTCSLWRSRDELAAYTYGSPGSAHRAALAEDRRRPFFAAAAFARFRLLDADGRLDGVNPLG